jgi:hypothetical protein
MIAGRKRPVLGLGLEDPVERSFRDTPEAREPGFQQTRSQCILKGHSFLDPSLTRHLAGALDRRHL